MDIYNQMSGRIIVYQERIIGPLAWTVAAKVSGLAIVGQRPYVSITADPKAVVNALVTRFEEIWGKLGVLECQEAASPITQRMNTEDIPERLR